MSSAEEQDKWLADAMALVQHNAFYMHRAVVRAILFSLVLFGLPDGFLDGPACLWFTLVGIVGVDVESWEDSRSVE